MQRLAIPALGVILLGACATTGGGPADGLPRQDRYYLIRPSEGYPLTLPSETRQDLDSAIAQLLDRGDTELARDVSSRLLGRDPDLAPARVLRSQVLFLDGRHDQVVAEMLPVVGSHPSYTSAQLLFGRSSEKLGNLVDALEAYRAIAEKSPLARSRSLEIEPRAIEIMAHRIEDALAKGDPVAAGRDLERLQSWAPESERTLALAAQVSQELDDPAAELGALRRLTVMQPDNEEMLERRAQLEMEIGDPASGLRLLEEAVSRDPTNRELVDTLARARFLWRLQLLPPEVRTLATASELDRGEFATILYWLFPDIRYGRGGDARIANDVLEHPRREQIVKVANSGVMDVDPSLHRFEPYRATRRAEALSAMLRILARKQPPVACLGGGTAPRSTEAICRLATACGLIDTEVDCQPSMPVGGPGAIDFCRQTQELLAAE